MWSIHRYSDLTRITDGNTIQNPIVQYVARIWNGLEHNNGGAIIPIVILRDIQLAAALFRNIEFELLLEICDI
jgi:hypothetical protein